MLITKSTTILEIFDVFDLRENEVYEVGVRLGEERPEHKAILFTSYNSAKVYTPLYDQPIDFTTVYSLSRVRKLTDLKYSWEVIVDINTTPIPKSIIPPPPPPKHELGIQCRTQEEADQVCGIWKDCSTLCWDVYFEKTIYYKNGTYSDLGYAEEHHIPVIPAAEFLRGYLTELPDVFVIKNKFWHGIAPVRGASPEDVLLWRKFMAYHPYNGGLLNYYSENKMFSSKPEGYPELSIQEWARITNTSPDPSFPFTITPKQARKLIAATEDECYWKRELLELWSKPLLMEGEVQVSELLYLRLVSAATCQQKAVLDSVFG